MVSEVLILSHGTSPARIRPRRGAEGLRRRRRCSSVACDGVGGGWVTGGGAAAWASPGPDLVVAVPDPDGAGGAAPSCDVAAGQTSRWWYGRTSPASRPDAARAQMAGSERAHRARGPSSESRRRCRGPRPPASTRGEHEFRLPGFGARGEPRLPDPGDATGAQLWRREGTAVAVRLPAKPRSQAARRDAPDLDDAAPRLPVRVGTAAPGPSHLYGTNSGVSRQ
ncbi:unnamed protein product [Urochloa humidicola]